MCSQFRDTVGVGRSTDGPGAGVVLGKQDDFRPFERLAFLANRYRTGMDRRESVGNRDPVTAAANDRDDSCGE